MVTLYYCFTAWCLLDWSKPRPQWLCWSEPLHQSAGDIGGGGVRMGRWVAGLLGWGGHTTTPDPALISLPTSHMTHLQIGIILSFDSRQTDGLMDICDSKVALLVTANKISIYLP